MPVLYYVRHGLTAWNAESRLQGRHDVPLIAQGRSLAVRSGNILNNLFERDGRAPADLGYVSSPLVRASATCISAMRRASTRICSTSPALAASVISAPADSNICASWSTT